MNKLTYLLIFATFLGACGEKDKKAQLEELRKQQAELKAQISDLEKELGAKGDTKDADNDKIKLVTVEKLSLSTFNDYIEVQGKVDADENVSVSPEMMGTVARVLVDAGQEVNKGQILAELDNKVYLQGIAELQNSLDFVTTVYEKQKSLWDQKIGTEIQYLQAKNNKESLEKKMATLQQQLAMTQIKSPINGTVDAVNIKVGETAAPGMPCIRVVNFDNMKVKGEVAEKFASKIKRGNPVTVILPDIKDSIMSEVSYVSKVISPLNRSFTTEVMLKNGNQYNPNMIAILKILGYTNSKALVIPINTVQTDGNEQYVFVANGNKAVRKKIDLGKVYGGKAEITSGLSAGDQLIVSGYSELNNGQAIKY